MGENTGMVRIHRCIGSIHLIYICYTYMYNTNILPVLHSCVKCLITLVLH